MAAVVEMWMNELGKLGEKVGGAARKRPLVVLSKAKAKAKAKEGEVKVEVEDKEGEEAKEIITRKDTVLHKDSHSSLSEETVFLLMDRFAPL